MTDAIALPTNKGEEQRGWYMLSGLALSGPVPSAPPLDSYQQGN